VSFHPRNGLRCASKHANARILRIAEHLIHACQAKHNWPGSNYCHEVRARSCSPRQRSNKV
jgi:hypothetical protein